MQLSKKILIPAAAVAVIAAGSYGTTKAFAANSPSTNSQTSLVQKLADTFHVDKSKVQAVFDQNKSDQQAKREKAYEARLDKAVTDNKLTNAQKALVLNEHNKLQAEIKSALSSIKAERKTSMNKIRLEAQDWAKANNIDAKWLMSGVDKKAHHKMMTNRPEKDTDDTSSPATSPTPTPGV